MLGTRDRKIAALAPRSGGCNARRGQEVLQQFAHAARLEVRHHSPRRYFASLPLHPGQQELVGIGGGYFHRRHTTRADGLGPAVGVPQLALRAQAPAGRLMRSMAGAHLSLSRTAGPRAPAGRLMRSVGSRLALAP